MPRRKSKKWRREEKTVERKALRHSHGELGELSDFQTGVYGALPYDEPEAHMAQLCNNHIAKLVYTPWS